MVFRITSGITIDGGLSSSGREPDPPSDVTATKINETTVRVAATDPVNLGGLPITTYTASAYLEYLQEVVYSTPGSYTWVVPYGVNSISIVAVGGGGGGGGGYINVLNGEWQYSWGGGGGGGGALSYVNNISVTPGETLTITAGAAGTGGTQGGFGTRQNGTSFTSVSGQNGTDGGVSKVVRNSNGAVLIEAGGGKGGKGSIGAYYPAISAGGLGGTVVVGTGGSGGAGGAAASLPDGSQGDILLSDTTDGGGGGGAGGYSGTGGKGGDGGLSDPPGNPGPAGYNGFEGTAGSGGGGGGGAGGDGGNPDPSIDLFGEGGNGGGVGLTGQGANGVAGGAGTSYLNGGGGSGGSRGTDRGGDYGGGGGGGCTTSLEDVNPITSFDMPSTVNSQYRMGSGRPGGIGAVRIIWAAGVSFPSNAAKSSSYELISSTTSNTNVINSVNNYGGGDGPIEYVFDGATFYEIPYNAKFELADNSFAIEAFITPTTTNVLRGIVNNWNVGGAFNWYINTNNTLTFTYTYTTSGINDVTYTGSTVIQPNVRTHVVIQKIGANMQFFINGVPDPVTYTGNFNFRFVYFYNNEKKPLRYGICSDGTGYFTGKMSNLRISFKQYLYGSGTNASFPVPSLPLETTQSAVNVSGREVIASLIPSEVLLLVLSDARPGKDKSPNDWSSALNGTIGITGKVHYAFKMQATNAAGTSLSSEVSNTIRYLGPNAPTIGTATRVENTSASVTFNAPADSGDGPVLDYIVVSSPGGFNATGASSPITVSGLLKGTDYTFTASARNKFATGTASAASNSVTAIGIPDAPTIGTATFASGSSATVTFTPTNNGGLTPITYTVKSYPEGKTASGSSTSLTVTGLTTGQTYYFTVTATNSLGTSPESSASNSLAFIVPNAPTVGLATMTGRTTARLQFTAPTNNGGPAVTSYTVVSTPGGITATGTSSPINLTGLTPGTSYTLKVYATNIIGNSSQSAASNEIVYVGPGQVTYTAIATNGTEFNWTVPAGITSISVIAVGGGGAGANGGSGYSGSGGGGGALSYVNDIAVTPNEQLIIRAGYGGLGGTTTSSGKESYIKRGSTFLVRAGGGTSGAINTSGGSGGTVLVGTGGDGGPGGASQGSGASGYGAGGGGGAGGYLVYGGYGGTWEQNGQAGNGGSAGGGGGGRTTSYSGGGGGGVGVLGYGSNGAGGSGATGGPGLGGSGGTNGSGSGTVNGFPAGGSGGYFGGGGGGGRNTLSGNPGSYGSDGGQGAVRIMWAGSSGLIRQFPSTNTDDIVLVDYVVVAGGGGGGIGAANYTSSGGGGGAGGMLSGNDVLLKTGVTYTITVGAGGSGGIASTTSGSSLTAPNNGVDSSISGSGLTTISAAGGGRGGSSNVFGSGSGGSGGGGSSSSTSTIAAGSGTAGQGNNGGSVLGSSTGSLAGGGGGASASGQSGNTGGSGRAGNGGDGLLNPFPEGPTYLAGGGGGSGTNTSGQFLVGGGGLGGGGSGYFGNFNVGSTSYPGTSGTGGGGGGLSGGGGSQYITNDAGNGGSGVVMLRIEASVTPTTVTGSPIITTVGIFKYYRWNGNGSIKF